MNWEAATVERSPAGFKQLAAEAARLQSFPDAFDFVCAMCATERQIGNVVPPVLAWHIVNARRERF